MELLNRFFVLTIALTSISAQAKESSDDAQAQQRAKDPRVRIWCKDGSFFRGEPLEIIPRSHVLLQIAEGRTIRIEWDKIVRHDSPEMGAVPSPALPKRTESSAATRNDVSPAPQTRTAPPLVPAPSVPSTQTSEVVQRTTLSSAATPFVSGLAPVTVRTTGMKQGALVEYLARSMEMDGPTWPMMVGSMVAEEWKPLCAVPCVARVDPDLPIRLRGPSIQTSSKIWLPSKGDRYEMEIKPGHDHIRTAAWVVFGVSAGLAVTGSLLLGIAYNEAGTTIGGADLRTGGFVVGAVGIVGLISSIPLFAKSTTTVEFYRE